MNTQSSSNEENNMQLGGLLPTGRFSTTRDDGRMFRNSLSEIIGNFDKNHIKYLMN